MNDSKYLASLREELRGKKADDTGDANALLDIAGDEEKLGELIGTLTDETASDATRRSALNVLHAVAVFSPVLPTKKPEYVNALRGLMDSDDAGLRKQAFTGLAVMKDEVAQARLREELTSGKNENDRAIASHHAIALLGFDEKALDASLLRDIAKNPPSDACLMEAVRHMPSDDAESAEVLLEIMEDDSKPLAVRRLVPDKVSNAHPAGFLRAVRKMISEKGLGGDLAPYLVSGVGLIDSEEAKSEVDETKAILKGLIEDAPASVKDAARKLLKDD